MQERTMDIKEFDSDEAAKEAGYEIPLTRKQAGELSEMNRKQRRDWLKAQRKGGYMPPKGKA